MSQVEHRTQTHRGTTVRIWSADNETYVGEMFGDKWHRIVCQYENGRCLGSPRPHWTSTWEFSVKGFSLISFLDEKYEGWEGQYEPSKLRYDEIDKQLLKLHTNAMRMYLKELSFWLPCHIYNDFTGDLYRP